MFEVQKPNYAGFVVIGAGLPRTGTMSLHAALYQLLDGACYHMIQVVANPDNKVDIAHWDKALKRKLRNSEWNDFLEGRGFRAGVDYPISMFYKELMQVFPEAKVVLTVREPEAWYNSVKNSIFSMHRLADSFPSSLVLKLEGRFPGVDMANRVSSHPPPGFDKSMFEVVANGKEESIEFYNKWVEEVKQTVPKDRLLVFSVKEGWKPLCDFLGVDIPDTPFPRVNDTATVQSRMRLLRLISYLMVLGVPAAVGVIAYFFRSQLASLWPYTN